MLQRWVISLFFISTLGACQHHPDWWRQFSIFNTKAEQSFNFNWQLSGDPNVAPLQLFNTSTQIWLQFAPEQSVPAVFAKNEHGLLPLRYQHQDPYLVIQGNWSHLLFRGGHLEAQAVRKPARAELTELSQDDSIALYDKQPIFSDPPELDTETTAFSTAQAIDLDDVRVEQRVLFAVDPEDQTVRHVLKRWAKAHDWIFNDQHWEVDIDLPIVSSAQFGSDFIQAVAQLMHSTTLSKKPVQACVYTNRVLRVIPSAQLCGPSTSTSIRTQG